MVSISDLRQEWVLAIAVILSFAFIIINVDAQLGNVYTSLFVVGMAMVMYFMITKKTPYYSINIIKPGYDKVMTGIYSIGGFGLFYIGSQFILQNFALVTQSVFELLQATSPVLSNIPEIQFVTFGILIPFLETFVFFVLGLDFILSLLNKNTTTLLKSNFWLIASILASLFTGFHFQAKLVAGSEALLQPALMVTAVFAIISVGLVVYRKQWFEALMLHIFINSFAMYQLLYA